MTQLGAALCGPGMNDRNKENPMSENQQRPVLVTTAHRGVFFGYAEGPTDGEQIVLKRARCCVMWRGVKGFLALASTGPTSSCRIGPPADLTLRAITAVAEVTPEAVAAWEKAPWA